MPNVTPNYGFYLPLVNDPTDQDLWGGYLNDNFDTLDSLLGNLTPSGVVSDYAGSTAPSGWLMCYGQAVSRTTYSTLNTVLSAASYPFGNGDGSTTFNVPDYRGRIGAGVDNMGGSAANLITNAVCGITGTTLGAAGGNQNIEEHTHSVTDPGHNHSPQGGGSFATYFGSTSITPVAGGGDLNGANTTTTSTTGITIGNYGAGSSANIQPTIMINKIIKT